MMGQAAIQSWSLWSLGLLLVGRIVVSHALDRMDARGRFELHPFSDAEQEGGTCTPSSLWGKEVAAMQLEIGCKEIKVGRISSLSNWCFAAVVCMSGS